MICLPHRCNDGYLVKKPYGKFRRRKLNNAQVSKDSTYSIHFLQIIQCINLIEKLDIDNDGNALIFKRNLPFPHLICIYQHQIQQTT